jgi:outer membrane lipopolysaccharide assembly protein LptE/RlpB
MRYKILQFLLYLLILTNCGFEVVNNRSNFKITELDASGDKKISFYLKNKLLLNSNNENNNLINLSIISNKTKSIKEKNISNQITKYEININTKVEYKILENETYKKFTVSKNGFYDVGAKHSDTLNNEKDLINLLIEEISEDILDNLAIYLNDL